MNLEIPYTVQINELVIKIRDENPNADNFELKRIFENKYRCKMIVKKWFITCIQFESEQDLILFLLKL